MSKHFIPFRTPARGTSGLLLAVNPSTLTHVSSAWDKRLDQSLLRLHLTNGRFIGVLEEDAGDVLEALGLQEFVEDWTLNLERDLG
jgi:hypothetical protein